MIRIAGTPPPPDDVAAIAAAIAAVTALAPIEPERAALAPWKLAARRPELDLDGVRAVARTRRS